MPKLVETIAIVGGVIAFSLPAHASQDTTEPVSTTETDEAAQDWEPNAATRIRCRRMPPPVGSRIGARRICATQMQWDRWRQMNRDVVENIGTRSRVGAN